MEIKVRHKPAEMVAGRDWIPCYEVDYQVVVTLDGEGDEPMSVGVKTQQPYDSPNAAGRVYFEYRDEQLGGFRYGSVHVAGDVDSMPDRIESAVRSILRHRHRLVGWMEYIGHGRAAAM